ncbi:MAG: protein kinase [Planctomycetes bacterium]|nr:protein kinase [Planctomycetota bacterium]
MSTEPSKTKGVAKKPPAPGNSPKPKPAAEPENVEGKVVRKDAGGKPKPPAGDQAGKPVQKAKKPAAASGQGKVIREDPPGRTPPVQQGTVDFEMSAENEDSEDAAAAFLTQEFSEDEASDEAPAPDATQAFDGDSLEAPADDDPLLSGATQAFQDEAESPRADADDAGPDGAITGAFANDTVDTELPKADDDLLDESNTQPVSSNTVDFDNPKGSAKRPPAPARKSAAPADAPHRDATKEPSMASMLGGKYKLLKKIGQGGMGAVYKAHDEKLDRIVAIKVLAKELSGKESYVKRFEREARVMIKLDHPNVIRCYDFDVDKEKGLHYLAIEFVDGGSVENWLKKLGRFSIGDALHIILKTAAGLQHAHEKSLIHRDVKPDNLLMTSDGIIKVADLGLAKDTAEDTSLTKTGAGAGTPIYMAPEQARDVKHVDARVDIYALGVMLYVFLTGEPPFKGNTFVELISAKEKGKFDSIRKHNDEVPQKLDLIVDKMMAKEPKNRYASCQEVIDEIEPLGLANEVLSFIEAEDRPAAATIVPGPKTAKTSGPAKVVAKTSGPAKVAEKTSVGGAGKAPAAKTSAPVSNTGDTAAPDDDVEQNVWYWTFVTEEGKKVTKRLTTDNVKALIKAGRISVSSDISKSSKGGTRGAGTYPEFQPIFKSMQTATTANVKGAKYRDKYKELEEEDAHRRQWGWLSRMFQGFGSTLMGLLWIALILAIVGAGGYLAYTYLK